MGGFKALDAFAQPFAKAFVLVWSFALFGVEQSLYIALQLLQHRAAVVINGVYLLKLLVKLFESFVKLLLFHFLKCNTELLSIARKKTASFK
jgi:hypothetical protein